MTFRLPLLKLFYKPSDAFRELSDTQPTHLVFFLFIGATVFSAYRAAIGPEYAAAVATRLHFPTWFANPNHLKLVGIPIFLAMPFIFSLSVHLIAKIMGSEGTYRRFLTSYLFLAFISTFLATALSVVPRIRWVLVLWKLIYSFIAIATAYEFTAGQAVLTGIFAGIGEMAVLTVFVIGLILSWRLNPKVAEQMLQTPAMIDTRLPADFNWASQSLDGKPVKMERFRGKVLVLNFWATWCFPCRTEMPGLQRLYDQVKDQGIEVASISEESSETVQNFLKNKHYTFPILTRYERMPFFRSAGIPVTFIISRDGYIVRKQEGAARWDSPEMISFLKTLNESPNFGKATKGDMNLGLDKRNVALIYNALGNKQIRRKQFREAEESLKHGLSLIESDPKPENAMAISVLDESLGTLYYKRGQYKEAEPLYLRSIEILEALPDPGKRNLIVSYKNLAALYRAMHRTEDARKATYKSTQVR